MKKLIASVIAAAAIAIPAAPAAADGVAMFGTKPCPAPYTGGTIFWHDTPVTPYEEIWLCIPGGPGAATTDATSEASARAGVTRCGGTGIIVWYYDLENRYQEPINTCL